jgi:glyoxylase-like metal-dependent hydrolase (beta-lactamase superfamily II)
MSHNRFLADGDSPGPVGRTRVSHATTTLIRATGATILVDPSLPGELLEPLLWERTGLSPANVDAVFLTSFRPTHRRGLALFDEADWLISPIERSFVIEQLSGRADAEADPDIEAELALAGRLKDAPDAPAEQISLFPAPGASIGSAALLLTPAAVTVAVAGDAIVHGDYFLRGQVWQGSADPRQAGESMAELVEIADLIVPGHDNVLLNPRGRFF